MEPPGASEEQPGSAPRGRVLFVGHDASRTGAPIFLLRFLSWLKAKRDLPFDILIGSHGELFGDYAALARTDLFEPRSTLAMKILRRLGLHRGRERRQVQRITAWLRAENIGTVYANSVASARMLDALAFLDCPVICHVHELGDAVRIVGRGNIEILRRRASVFIAVSHAVARNLTDSYGIPAEKIRVIHGFVPVAELLKEEDADAAAAVRSRLGIPAEARLVCGCGSIGVRKGSDLFLEVARQVAVPNRGAPVHFLWVGGQPAAVEKIRAEAAAAGLGAVMHFIGDQESVAPYFQASDVFLLTSREDPFPLVMLEAALFRTPIVCFADTGGAPEFLEGDAGFAVPKFDVAAMAGRLTELLQSPELRERMGSAARRKVIERHDLEQGAPRLAAVIEEHMKKPARAAQAFEKA